MEVPAGTMSDESDPEFIPEDNEFGTADDGPAERGEDGHGDTEEAKFMEDAGEPRRGKGKGKGRGGRRGRPSVTKGWRICAACAKHCAPETMGVGSRFCLKDKPAVQNLANAAASQGKKEWWASVLEDPLKLRKVVFAYHARCPTPAKGAKRPVFKILQYEQEVKQEESMMFDSVKEMMHVISFVHHMAKPKNGGLMEQAARDLFAQLMSQPKAIVDQKGPAENCRARVAIHVKDLVIDRSASIRSRGFKAKDAENKKATDGDALKLRHRLQKESAWAGGVPAEDFCEQAAESMARSSRTGAKMFSEDGKGALCIDDLADFDTEEEVEEEGDQEADDDNDDGEEATGDKSKSKRGAAAVEPEKTGGMKSKRTPWFNRDEKVAAAITEFRHWGNSMRSSLQEVKNDLETLDKASQASEDIRAAVEMEHTMAVTRQSAVSLVLGHRVLYASETTPGTLSVQSPLLCKVMTFNLGSHQYPPRMHAPDIIIGPRVGVKPSDTERSISHRVAGLAGGEGGKAREG